MACCWARAAERSLPASRDTDFDRLVLGGFARVLESGGVFRTDPESIQRRTLSGPLGVAVQVNKGHFAKKRKAVSAARVVGSSDPDAFNFSKANAAEKIAEIEAFPPGHPTAGATTVLANVSPLAVGHVLFVPFCHQALPQVMTEELFLCGLHLLAKSGRQDFRLVFNSLMGFASVNHFHWHGLYLNSFAGGLPDARLPVERVDRSVISGAITEGRASIELLVETQWYTRGFVVTAGCKEGTPGANPPADLGALASLAFRLVAELQRRNIAHNILLAPPCWRQRKAIAGSMAHEQEAKPNAVTPEVYIFPRQPQDKLRDGANFNAAVLEVAGLIVAHDEASYQAFTEESLKEIFKEDVSMPDSSFDDLICKVAWLPT